jgi:TRAP-type mannitol/chloroaromatic compound transport system permease small subunit
MAGPNQPMAGAPGRRASPFGRLAAGANGVGTIGIVALMVLINADVFRRFLFNSPIAGVPEMVSLSIVGIVFLQVGHTLRMGRFIRSDMALARLLAARPRAGHALQALHHATGAVLSALLLYFSAGSFVDIWRSGETVGTFGVFEAPVWPVALIIVFGCVMMLAQFAAYAAADIAIASGLRPASADAVEPDEGTAL